VEQSEKALNDYASRNTIIFVDAGNNQSQSTATKNFSDVSSALSAATTERLQKRHSIGKSPKQTHKTRLSSTTPYPDDEKSTCNLEAEYYNLSKTFTPDYPR